MTWSDAARKASIEARRRNKKNKAYAAGIKKRRAASEARAASGKPVPGARQLPIHNTERGMPSERRLPGAFR